MIHKFESFSVRQPISLLLFLQSKPTLILLDGISLIVSFFDSKTLFFSFYLFIFQKQYRKLRGEILKYIRKLCDNLTVSGAYVDIDDAGATSRVWIFSSIYCVDTVKIIANLNFCNFS